MIEILQLLHACSQTSTRYSRSYYVRHLEADEALPQFGHGIPESNLLQREWIWIAFDERDNNPVAILVAAPTQGIVNLLRIYAIKEAKRSVLPGLLRKSLADMLSRGYTTYAVYLCPDRVEESVLARIVTKAGGKESGGLHSLYYGPTEIRW